MAFILTDTTREGHNLQLNVWHWHTILALLDVAAVLPKEKIESMGTSGACPTISQTEARAIATGLRERVIPLFAVDDRVFIDGTTTKDPDDGTFYRDPKEHRRNYSTNGEVLRKLASFCEACGDLVLY